MTRIAKLIRRVFRPGARPAAVSNPDSAARDSRARPQVELPVVVRNRFHNQPFPERQLLEGWGMGGGR